MLLDHCRVMILMTSHNRKEQTIRCIRSLKAVSGIETAFVVVDAGSTDGTCEALREEAGVKLIRRGGELYWNGGMRVAMSYAAKHGEETDYVFLVNDDVEFFPGALQSMLERLEGGEAKAPESCADKTGKTELPPAETCRIDAVVGATKNAAGEQTYGGVRMKSKRFARFELIPPSGERISCDTFNCNALLIRYESFQRAGNLDAAYVHSLGDYDYGMKLNRLGMQVVNSADYVGICEGNAVKGSWLDPKLSRSERLKKKESEKGLPGRDWYHFLRKNYGLTAALYHSITPYARILLGI